MLSVYLCMGEIVVLVVIIYGVMVVLINYNVIDCNLVLVLLVVDYEFDGVEEYNGDYVGVCLDFFEILLL